MKINFSINSLTLIKLLAPSLSNSNKIKTNNRIFNYLSGRIGFHNHPFLYILSYVPRQRM